MTGAQKVIKYIAISLAMFIILNICGMAIFGLSIIAAIFGLDTNEELSAQEKISELEDLTQIKELDIEIKYAKFNIKKGNVFKVESNDNNIYVNENSNKIEIKDRSDNWLSTHNNKEVTVYIPENIVFENLRVETGAGKVDIELLKAKKLTFIVGAGSTQIKELNISKEARINGGAGRFEISSGNINNLELNVGVGKTEIKAEISGNSKIESGVGKLDIHLKGNDYQIETENGLGAIKINGDKVENNYKYGNGNNTLKIHGGIGAIDIDFVK